MRIMLDTNTIISMAVFNDDKLKELLIYICDNHTLVLSSYIVEELEEVVKRKFPNKINSLNKFLYKINFEFTYTPNTIIKEITIKDLKKLPNLNSAILSNIDIFITEDKELDNIIIDKPKIMNVTKFLEKYRPNN